MKILLVTGVVLLALGVLSLFVPIPRRESHGIRAGDVDFGVQVQYSEKVSPVVSATLIGGGIALLVAGSRKKA